MGKDKKIKFKKGAASFYIVAFSTLILLIVAASFASVIISEIERTSNNDLSQSAYDSAMAGIEDAKLAYYNYQNCVANGDTAATSTSGALNCGTIMYYIEEPKAQDCDMVAKILGRGTGEVEVSESTVGNNMQQAYTCVKIQTILDRYESELSGSEQTRVIKTNFASDSGANIADKITKVKISWSEDEGASYQFTNFANNAIGFWQSAYQPAATPPTISVAMLQTAENFNLNDFDVTIGSTTDRGMVYLVPTGNRDIASQSVAGGYSGAWTGSENYIGINGFLVSNSKIATNVPYAVYCNGDGEYVCSTTIEVPRPVADAAGKATARNQDTFIFVVSLPYGKPTTSFALEFFCDDGVACATTKSEGGEEASKTEPSRAYLDSVQIKVDSTGRANDLYRRVEAWLESSADSSYLSIIGPLELMGNNSGSAALEKNYVVKSEWNF